jgi:hypothetical protein
MERASPQRERHFASSGFFVWQFPQVVIGHYSLRKPEPLYSISGLSQGFEAFFQGVRAFSQGF